MNYFKRKIDELKPRGITVGALTRLFPKGEFRDMLFHFPTSVIDRSNDKLLDGEVATVKGKVLSVSLGYGRRPANIVLQTKYGELTLTFFKFPPYLRPFFKQGNDVAVSGKVKQRDGRAEMSHPDYMLPASQYDEISGSEPVYPLTYAITNKTLRKYIDMALKDLEEQEEWLPTAEISFAKAIKALHKNPFDEPARRRIAYDEILANQLALAISRQQNKQSPNAAIASTGTLMAELKASLPYSLTNAQENAIREIVDDLKSPRRTMRLLQGDVGCGKTIVALLAALFVIEGGGQVAIMAPTEILATQHLATIRALLPNTSASLITGRSKGSTSADIIIGTHALFQEKIEIPNLKLAIVDEQHKFGVNQRRALAAKGELASTNMIYMSATPIPRTLAMTIFGDMDLTTISELPPNRTPQKTIVVAAAKLKELAQKLNSQLQSGAIKKAYWVCPLIDESEKLKLSNVETRFKDLQTIFGGSLGLTHGRIKPEDKEKTIADFADPNGKIKVLLSTTVIEVGVNVPDATIMVIEESQRFGLSTLHQLRGRIGRGGGEATCILAYSGRLSATASERLKVMKETTDGFKIAETDLRIRGSGDIVGTKQSGELDFYLANPTDDMELFSRANKEAAEILASPARLEKAKILMEIFG